MEGLRAERDEVGVPDKKVSAPKSTSQYPGSGKSDWEPPVSAHLDSGNTAKGGTKTGWFQHLLMGLLLCAAAVGGWAYYQQTQEIRQLRHDLADASDLIRQSKLLMARFEGQLIESGEEQNKTGTEVEKQLKFLDTEMRKLWGVSNDRNKKAIAENKEVLESFKKSLNDLQSEVSASEKMLKEHAARMVKSEQSLKDQAGSLAVIQGSQSESVAALAKLTSSVSDNALQVGLIGETIDRLKAENEELKARMVAMGDTSRLTKVEKAIEAIDVSRLQVNQRLVAMERKLNDAQLAISALNATQKK